ncbi:uncharacterized protein TNCV_1114801 [Trichonephila clavipes]|nr:uncharacterized protein TNCV_1114801 [Trichonephila clavipes]
MTLLTTPTAPDTALDVCLNSILPIIRQTIWIPAGFWQPELCEVNHAQNYLQTEGLNICQSAQKIPALQTVLEANREEFVNDALIYAKSLCEELEVSFEPQDESGGSIYLATGHIYATGWTATSRTLEKFAHPSVLGPLSMSLKYESCQSLSQVGLLYERWRHHLHNLGMEVEGNILQHSAPVVSVAISPSRLPDSHCFNNLVLSVYSEVFDDIGHRTQAFRSGVRCSNH